MGLIKVIKPNLAPCLETITMLSAKFNAMTLYPILPRPFLFDYFTWGVIFALPAPISDLKGDTLHPDGFDRLGISICYLPSGSY